VDNDDEVARANRARHGSPFLNSDQASAYLKISIRLLKQLRRSGKGPTFRRHSNLVQYHVDDLDDWSRERSKRKLGR